MIAAAESIPPGGASLILTSAMIFGGTAAACYLGYQPLKELVLRRQQQYATVLRGTLLLDVQPRTVSVLSAVAVVLLAIMGYLLAGSLLGAVFGGAVGVALPSVVLRLLQRRRIGRLESQLVGSIQTLASGVRAGLNLIQAMELLAKDGPIPLRQEFAHLLREYNYGVALEDAMNSAVTRIGSTDFRLLFAALLMHRQRGGDLGVTLDRIAESIREIQRLENRLKTLTAQGRATARWLGAMPIAVLAILYFMVDAAGVRMLFADDAGKLILLTIAALNIVGFLWIRKIVSIDI